MKFVLKLISVITAIVSKLWSYRIMGYAKYLIGFFYSQWICRSLNYDRSNYFGRRFVISGHEKVKIGVKNAFGHDMMISVWEGQKSCNLGQVTIGNNCDFGYFNHITCCNKITIGNGVLTGMYVIISDNNHGHLTLDEQIMRPVDRPLHSKGEVVIGDNVWIGDKVAILAGVHIGEGAVVAANAVVTRDVAANTVVAGAPAKVIKEIK